MSEIQDLIYRSTMIAYEQGAKDAEARINQVLEQLWQKAQGTQLPAVVVLHEAMTLIKDGQK